MGKEIYQPDFNKEDYLTSLLFKLKSKPAALYSALSGFALNGVNMTKLQSFPEKILFLPFSSCVTSRGTLKIKKLKIL